jgi:hypothetical protein
MNDELFEKGVGIKRELRLLTKTLRSETLLSALEYIEKLEIQLVTAEGTINGLEGRQIKRPIAEILNDFKDTKTKQPASSGRIVKEFKRPKIEKKELPIELQNLGDKVIESFIALVRESKDWGGDPCVGASESGSSLRGALPHLKRAGFLNTVVKADGSKRGNGTYVQFTDLGKKVAEEIAKLLDLTDPI